jgi:peptide deformylase
MSEERAAVTPEPLPIVQAGDPVLRRPTRPLTPEEIRGEAIQRLVAFMRDTMRSAPGVGLAAPQIGESLRIAVIEDREEYVRTADAAWLAERERTPVPFHVIVNPELTVVEADPAAFFEGCLSVEGYTAIVPRARAVRVSCLDELARPRTIEARGWYARILQHEIDHLDGMLYVDRMHTRTFMTTANHARLWKNHAIEAVCAELGESRLSDGRS